MISRHIMRSTARFPSAVGVGVPDDPFLRPPPTSPRSASPRRGGVPSPPGVTVSARPTAARRLRAAGAARKGGTPGEGSPFDPLLRFVSTRAFRALRRASKGSAPGPPPLFYKKAGGVQGRSPWTRAAARGTLLCSQSAGGGQRGDPRRGSPLCGRPPPPAAPALRRGAGGGRRKGSSGTPTPTAGGRRPVCHVICCEIVRRPGWGWRNVARSAETTAAGRRGRRPLQGLLRRHNARGNPPPLQTYSGPSRVQRRFI